MEELILLASGLLFPLLAFFLIRYGRENIPLLLRLLGGTGVICGLVALLPDLGFVYPAETGILGYEIIRALADMSSLVGGALVAAAWILALFQAVREGNTRWIWVLVVSGIIAYLARVIFQYPGFLPAFGLGFIVSESLILLLGLYALSLLGGITAFLYGVHSATPSGLPASAQAALDDDEFSTITIEPL